TVSQAWWMSARGCLAAMIGRFDEARELMRGADEISLDLGLKVIHAANHPHAEVELYADNPQGVLDRFEPGIAILEEIGEHGFLSTTAGYLAEASYRLGRMDEAERYAVMCRENATDDDVASQVQWRSALGKVLASRGEVTEGVRLATEGAAIAESTDQIGYLGTAYVDLAEVLRMAGDEAGAAERYRAAIELYERKGATFLVEKVRARLAELDT
ncbi:MAG: hypothetical protein ACRDJP_14560, partial [Actinomycetota bacterium]